MAALVLALVVTLVVVSFRDDDGETAVDVGTTTSLLEVTSTTAQTDATASTTAPATTATSPGVMTGEEAATVVWPDPLAGAGYDDTEALVRAFSVDALGFVEPLVGEYQAGDSRSGEFEVRPVEDGPVTTVGVRRMSDDRYYVVFAATSEVELILPVAGSAIDHPLQVEGWGRGFEGRIRVSVHDRRTSATLGEGFVTGGAAGELAPFRGDVEWDNPGGGWGFVVASVSGGDDATTWAATALPVGYIGGD